MSSEGRLSFFKSCIEDGWVSAVIASAVGVMAALAGRILIFDRSFRIFLEKLYRPVGSDWNGPKAYQSYLFVISIALILALLPLLVRFAARWLRSFTSAATSGLVLGPFVTSFIIFSISQAHVVLKVVVATIVAILFLGLNALLSERARERSSKRIQLDEIWDRKDGNRRTREQVTETDEPIRSWQEDLLGRGPLVNSLLVALLINKTPVVGLFGEFGSGKSSILNLLYNELCERAIVIRFNPWLPGSSEALATQLLGDIALECNRKYYVPGLRNDARRVAAALGKGVPMLSVFSELVFDGTQHQEIKELQSALARLPKPVVVLLDEVDRMQKEEILSLLKVIRGLGYPPNLSFVVASDRITMERVLFDGDEQKEASHFLEKFFPALIRVPVIDSDIVQNVGIQRLLKSFTRQQWFQAEADERSYEAKLEEQWPALFSPFITTLRGAGLLANDVSIAAPPLRSEVNPLDLTLIEMLKRFEQRVYESVWLFRETLTGGANSTTYVYKTDDERKQLRKEVVETITKSIGSEPHREATLQILRYLFPLFRQYEGKSWASDRRDAEEDNNNGIADPRHIAAYFRYQLPADLFSVASLNSFLDRFYSTEDESEAKTIFDQMLSSMEAGSEVRSNFIERLSDRVKSSKTAVHRAEKIARIAMRAANQYVYDWMVFFGEAGYAFQIVLEVAKRLSWNERVAFLSDCIDLAADDTMAFRIQTVLSKPNQRFDLQVSFKDLYPAFIKRMRRLYGPGVNAREISLENSSGEAFNLWGAELAAEGISIDPIDRVMQRDFWLRYITSRSVLAQVFDRVFMPNGLYREDPSSFVENKILLTDLRKLSVDLADNEQLTTDQQKSLRRLEQLLTGDFKNGFNPMDIGPPGG